MTPCCRHWSIIGAFVDKEAHSVIHSHAEAIGAAGQVDGPIPAPEKKSLLTMPGAGDPVAPVVVDAAAPQRTRTGAPPRSALLKYSAVHIAGRRGGGGGGRPR